jgi:hypothetical protein
MLIRFLCVYIASIKLAVFPEMFEFMTYILSDDLNVYFKHYNLKEWINGRVICGNHS